MSSAFENKVVFVTGAGSGIGEATAKAFAHESASVAIADIDFDAAERVASEITSKGGKAIAYKLDVSDDAAVAFVLAQVEKDFGALHIAHNNAGILGDIAPLVDQSNDSWCKVMSVNLDGVFYSMKHEIPLMKKSGYGSIINMSSIMGAVAFANSSAYIASKHAIVGLTKAAAIECAVDGIRVNSVGPSVIKTPILDVLPQEDLAGIAARHPVNRLGTCEEVAALILFLASPAASFVTGSYYAVDGGYLAW
jgi:NAD(P)-dependent dehydrogenase (short-subunit alcohol dehydrogenase family)